MARRMVAALLAGMITTLAATAAAEPGGTWAEVDEQLSALTDGPQAPLGGLAVVLVADGRIVHQAAYGCAVFGTDGRCERPLTIDTPVRAASLSKVAVGLTAMELAEQGRLDLDRDVSDYLGFTLRNPNAPDAPITVRMLLDHRSSLRDGEIYALPVQYDLTDLVLPGGAHYSDSRWATGHEAQPGTWFTYTNLNYGVLAAVIERVTGERFDMVVERRLLEPLGIPAAFDVRRLSDASFALLAPGYRRLKDGEVALDGTWTPQVDDYRGTRPDDMVSPFGVQATQPLSAYRPGMNGTTLSPQGGLRISAAGLARLMRMMLGDGEVDGVRVLSPGSVAEMTAHRWRYDPDNPNGNAENGLYRAWGTGLHCGVPVAHPAAGRYCGHLADAYGVLGGMFFDPATGRGFVYLITGTGAPVPPGHTGALGPWEEGVATTLLEALSGR